MIAGSVILTDFQIVKMIRNIGRGTGLHIGQQARVEGGVTAFNASRCGEPLRRAVAASRCGTVH